MYSHIHKENIEKCIESRFKTKALNVLTAPGETVGPEGPGKEGIDGFTVWPGG